MTQNILARSRDEMHPYQERLVDWIKANERTAAWVGMGMGKTVSTLTALQDLKDACEWDRGLIVAPPRVARSTWTNELWEWEHLNLSIDRVLGTPKQRLEILHDSTADLLTISQANFMWLRKQYYRNGRWLKTNPWPFDVLVCDESSGYKDRYSQRGKAFYKLSEHAPRVVELTGTPAPNYLLGVWAQMMYLDRGAALGTEFGAFKNRWFDYDPYTYTYTAKPFAEQEIHDRIKHLVMSMRSEDYLDLPPVMSNPIYVEMTKSERRAYDTLRRAKVLQLPGGKVTAKSAGILANKLLQLANGALYDEDRTVHHIHDQKVEALKELVTSVNGNMIIVYNFRHDLIRIQKALDQLKKKWRVLDTEKDEDDWNAGKIPYLILHPASAGHGLNIQHGGDEIVWFGMTWNLEHFDQTVARVAGGMRRLGKNVVNHMILCRDTRDESALFALEDKRNVDARLVMAMRKEISACAA